MSFIIGSTTLANSSGVNFPSLSSNPGSPVAGQVYYNTTSRELRRYNGVGWEAVLGSSTAGFKYRQIISKSFVMGGYKDSSPWKNVNRMTHSTDVCTNLGDVMTFMFHYVQGAPSRTKAWVFGASNAVFTASANVIAMNLVTEAGIAHNSGNNLSGAVGDAGVAFKEHDFCYVLGKGNPDKFNFATETSAASGLTNLVTGGVTPTGSGAHAQAINHDDHALVYSDGGGQELNFETNTLSTVGSVVTAGSSNQQKAINSKLGKGYAGNEGSYNGGYNYRITNLITNTTSGTTGRPHVNNGEENFDMGQDWQYMMGEYNGAQNNNGHKFYYATDSGVTLGSGSVRTGVPGGSSGATGWI